MALALSVQATALVGLNVPPMMQQAVKVRFNAPLMQEAEVEKAVAGIENAEGVVVPTGIAATPEAAMPEPPKPKRLASATWNPKDLKVPPVPKQAELFAQQFEPDYLTFSPDYLDGSLPGDVGFDPWALTVLAKPTLSVDALQALDSKSRTAKERNARMLAMTPEEQQEALMWMRSSELKHGRLAMLAVAGWPLAEMLNYGFLHKDYTNGRAPSLFNGHLPDYLPFLTVFFGGLAALEIMTKDKVKDGDYGFDPLGFASGIGARRTLETAEVKHGRAAMMGITGFAVQEFLYGTPVVEQTPFFFLPLGGFGR